MTKREPLMSETYFDEQVSFRERTIDEWQRELPQYANKVAAYFSMFQYRFAAFVARYSCGYPVATMVPYFLRILDAWEVQRAADTDKTYGYSFKNELGDYVESLALVSLAILLRVEPRVMNRLLVCIGNEGQDLLFERLVMHVADDIVRKPAKKLLYPKAYQPLYDALDAPIEQRAVLVQQFLQDWYKRIKAVGWHDAHKGPDGGGFFGYWCWEAAGVALAFGIDDTPFRQMPYYPRDLADYARAPG